MAKEPIDDDIKKAIIKRGAYILYSKDKGTFIYIGDKFPPNTTYLGKITEANAGLLDKLYIYIKRSKYIKKIM